MPEKNWPKFHAALNTAKSYMLSIKNKADHNPEWYISMIRISRGLGENEMDFKNLVKEALNKHPDYYEIYFTLSEFLKPKWGGSIEKIENLANYGVEKTSENEGMGLYARYYWSIYQNERPEIKEEFFKYYNLDWSKMKQGMYDILKKYPDPWNINNFAYLACAAKDKEVTKDLIAKVKDHLLSVWETTLKFDNCRRWANGQPVEKSQEGSDLNYFQMMMNQWFQQLSYVFNNEDYEQYRQGFIHFYDHNISKDYKRDFKIKYTSVCEKNDDPAELTDKVQSMTQTKEEFFTAETSLKFQKGYNSYEHAISNLSYNEDTRIISLGYNLKLAGHLEEIGGFAGSEVKAFPFDEFRECSASFVYTEDNLLKMTKENCEVLVQKGCSEKPKKRPKNL